MSWSLTRYDVDERCSAVYTAVLTDEVGNAVPLASISSLVVSLIDNRSGAVINNRAAQDVKNANGGTVGATDGSFSLTFAPADNAIVSSPPPLAREWEEHIAIFTLKWASSELNWSVLVRVRRIRKVPQ